MKRACLLAAAVTLISQMGFTVGSASATSVTATTGGATATPTIHLVSENGHITLKNSFATISCASTLEGSVSGHGAGVTTNVGLSTFQLTGCTNSWHSTSITNGILEIHWESGHNGIITSTGAKIDATRFGLTCIYETNQTTLGTVTGGNPATLTLAGNIPINQEGGPSCGKGTIALSGSYVTTSVLYVEP